MFRFDEFLTKLGIDISQTRLLRHDTRGIAAFRSGGLQKFGCWASFQGVQRPPYAGAQMAAHFIPGPALPDGDVTALFLGITKVLDRWEWDGMRLPALQDAAVLDSERQQLALGEKLEAFDLEWLELGIAYSERLLVRWGKPSSARAWSQWASNDKEILELKLDRHDPPFPGFSSFVGQISEVALMPQAWQAALASVRGVYLLVTEAGEQYVGSATGQDGLLGRWLIYASNGHGGNVVLRDRGHREYSVSILEVASPDMSKDDVVARESHWKRKLGARVHGLNEN